jgi:hypothetical protein
MRARVLFALGVLAVASASAFAGGDKPAPAGKPAEAVKGPQIRWAHSFVEAMEEASERNVPIFLHSHGST